MLFAAFIFGLAVVGLIAFEDKALSALLIAGCLVLLIVSWRIDGSD